MKPREVPPTFTIVQSSRRWAIIMHTTTPTSPNHIKATPSEVVMVNWGLNFETALAHVVALYNLMETSYA